MNDNRSVWKVRCLACVLFALLANTPLLRADAVDDYILRVMEDQHIPGLALAVVSNGKTVKVKGYGLANVEWEVPVSGDTVFEIASITKTMTATAIMLLVEDGKVSLDDSLSDFIDNAPAAWKQIKIHHLLSHTSGLPRDVFQQETRKIRIDYRQDELLEMAREHSLLFQPGDKFAYSNLGYFLLGEVIEKTSRQKYAEFVRRRVLLPLGMSSTRMVDHTAIVPRRASGYLWRGSLRVGDYVSPNSYAPAGAVLSTAADMAKWSLALKPGHLLKASTLRRMLASTALTDGSNSSTGLGWGTGFVRGHSTIGHNGGVNSGFESSFVHFHELDLSIVVLFNSFSSRPAPRRIANAVAGFYRSSLKPLSLLEPSEDPDTSFTKSLLGSLGNLEGKAAVRLFIQEYRQELLGQPDRTAALAHYVDNATSLEYLADDPTRANGSSAKRYYRAIIEDEPYDFSLSLTTKGRIWWINIDRPIDKPSRVKQQMLGDSDETEAFLSVLSQCALGVNDIERTTSRLRDAITPEFSELCSRQLNDLKSFDFVARRDNRWEPETRLGVRVTHKAYYRLNHKNTPDTYVVFHLDKDGTVADFDVLYE